MSKIAYPIQAVSNLTGLSIDTLRAWERRYEAIKPSRDARRRVYDAADVRRLILLREAVDGGHAISKVAALSNQNLEKIKQRSAVLSAFPARSSEASPQHRSLDLQILHDAVRGFDCLAFDQELNRLAAAMAPRSLVHEVVVPLMNDIGDRWYRGELTIAQEHMVSGALRNLLGSLMRLFTTHQPVATVLFATPQGERHEFGILCAAMLASIGGLGVACLGVDLPCAQIVDAAEKTGAGVLVLGMKAATSGKDSLRELHRISEALPASIELWVGGLHAVAAVRDIKSTRARYLRNLSVLETELIRLGARF